MFRPYIQIGEWQGWDSPEAPGLQSRAFPTRCGRAVSARGPSVRNATGL